MMEKETFFVDVLLPLPLPNLFTYRVPRELSELPAFGMRVVVQFGRNKLYSALVVRLHTDPPAVEAKYVLDVIDDRPIITEKQFALWKWLAEYYMCTLGEVMAAALPSALKLAGETKIMLHPAFDGDISALSARELRVLETLSSRPVMTVQEISKATDMAKVMPVIKSLVEKEIVMTDEEIRNPYKPKIENFISLCEPYASQEQALYQVLDDLSKSKKTEKQSDALLAFLMEKQKNHGDASFRIRKAELLQKISISVLKSLLKKEILEEKEVKISRLPEYDLQDKVSDILLSDDQQKAYDAIKAKFSETPAVLLHGVTGSGKTELYIKLIDEVLAQGKQVLYLLPEIALTTQIVNRLRKYFGDMVGVYHSRFNEYERVEIWNRVLLQGREENESSKYRLILGARSALLLPYANLGLIIVDEEHDASYKQVTPAPRYHARDAALVLASIHNCHTLLGTATPSLESYANAKQGKYGLVELKTRFAGGSLPEIFLVDMGLAQRQKQVQEHLSQFLVESIREALENNEQVILFQNRRGYSLRMFCNACQTMPTCVHCDVTLTYHKQSRLLKCHYCGYAIEVPRTCPTCGSPHLEMQGFGTEKVEEALATLFPDAVIDRMDLDTTRSKNAYQRIISNFEAHKTDILVGTQMVTKGLDFDRVSVVGILNADALMSYPDFRSFEHAFQVLAQVSGRAGRRNTSGKVIVQTYQPKHEALKYVVGNNYSAMFESQMEERRRYVYPPFCRLIKITLKHADEESLNKAAAALAAPLNEAFPQQVLGPAFPPIARIQNYFLKDFWLKFPKNGNLSAKKKILAKILLDVQSLPVFKNVKLIVNVDC